MENDSADRIEPLQVNTESSDPPPSVCESTMEGGSDDQLRLFVTLLTVRVMKKCQASENGSPEAWAVHIKRLVDQTMEGLNIDESCLDIKDTKKVCKAVMKDLEKRYGRRRLLGTLISLEEPAVDAAIVRSLQTHIKELPARSARKTSFQKRCKEALQVAGFTLGLFVALVIIAVIP